MRLCSAKETYNFQECTNRSHLIPNRHDGKADFRLIWPQYNNAPSVDMDEVFDAQFLRAYIAQAHRYQPYVPASLSEYITGAYIR